MRARGVVVGEGAYRRHGARVVRLRGVSALGVDVEALEAVEFPPVADRRELRVAVGLTQADVADLVGTATQNVARWEAGSSVPSGAPGVRYWLLVEQLRRVLSAA